MNRDDLPTAQNLRHRRAARIQAELEAKVVVTVLGDGRGTAGYEKRLTVRDHLLRNVQEAIEVTIPEEIASDHPDAKLDEVESAAIESAHVVLCIEAPDQEPLGLYTEVARYFKSVEADKWFRLWPINRPDPLHSSLVAGLAGEFLARIDEYPYQPEQWESCQLIRMACARRVRQTALRRQDSLLERKAIERRHR